MNKEMRKAVSVSIVTGAVKWHGNQTPLSPFYNNDDDYYCT